MMHDIWQLGKYNHKRKEMHAMQVAEKRFYLVAEESRKQRRGRVCHKMKYGHGRMEE